MNANELRAINTAREQLLPLNQRTEESKASAQRRDKKTHTELNEMRHLPTNASCADCGAKHPGWAALPHGVFLCIDCAQIHRGIGRHISQVKCISSHTYLWYPDEVAIMKTMGNERAKRYFGVAHRPDTATDHASRVKFAKDKYEAMKWAPAHEDLADTEAQAEAAPASPPPSASVSSGAARFERKREAAKSGRKGFKSRSPRSMAAVPLPLDTPTAKATTQPQTPPPAVDLLTPAPSATPVPTSTPMPMPPATTTQPATTATARGTADAQHAAQVSSIMSMYQAPGMAGMAPVAFQAAPVSRAPPPAVAATGGADFFGEFGL